jgi:hypothetical protein
MHRLLIAAGSLSLVAAVAAPALADDYPVCSHRDQDHCRVMVMPHHMRHHHPAPHHMPMPMHSDHGHDHGK